MLNDKSLRLKKNYRFCFEPKRKNHVTLGVKVTLSPKQV
jgi:hypothetical protein